ncbi:O-succinylhomoserine sulfhydrylase [Derxia gummosa]|uniref:O-succinylhomoserine sulfhydrylase n=1 Tax=Derxia gummosa DSM 723 TaxID=1121388 RepID=A0A8B6XA08_9BURK|nr:O-succinylhomoserine sulfhydrylase [Derxia gummosa]
MQDQDFPSQDDWAIETLAVRAGTARSGFGEHAEAMFLTSSYVFGSAAEAADRFSNKVEGNVYSRFTNPTVTMFEQRLAALEGAEAALATASGMSAILTCCMGVLKAGDHVVASTGLFGSTVQLFNNILSKFGITTSYVSPADPAAWRAAVRPETKLFYVETPSNPMMELADIPALASVAKDAGALLVVDNCFCTPALQQPLKLGADVVIHSATKYIDGQGRVLGGAIVGSKAFIKDQMLPFLRTAGPTLSPFNAWVLLKGLETLAIRMERQSENALAVARWLEAQPQVKRVIYPGLESHPQHELAKRQQKTGGAVLSFELRGETPEQQRTNAWRVIDNTRLVSITANLGDTRTTITHPATTTHGRVAPEVRAAAGITEGMIRLAVGLESPEDLCRDLARGMTD